MGRNRSFIIVVRFLFCYTNPPLWVGCRGWQSTVFALAGAVIKKRKKTAVGERKFPCQPFLLVIIFRNVGNYVEIK